MSEQSVWLWNAPATQAGRAALRQGLAAIGCTKVVIKAGGDGGVAWIAGVPLPSFARPQWSGWVDDLTDQGVPFFYATPGDADKTAVVRALAARDCAEIVLNPETEWRVQSNQNPWSSLAEANAAAEAWVADLRVWLPHSVRIGYSSCPTWADFPYEGFAAACDYAAPQHYWPASAFTNGEDEVMAHVRRAGTAKPCVPILTACGEYDDAGVVALAQSALTALPTIAGLSAWEAGNGAFQASAIQQSYALLPADLATDSTPAPVDPANVAVAINDQGETVMTINFGGFADRVIGYVVPDAGVTVGNGPAVYDRSIKGAFQPWSKRPV